MKALKMELTANEKFSLCIPAGQYEAKDIYFTHDEDIDKAVDFPKFTFQVRPGKVNYIGDILLNVDTAVGPGVYLVPHKLERRSSTGWGAMFGLVGGVIEAATTDYSVKQGYRMRVQADEHFITTMPLPLEFNLARFEPREFILNPGEKK